MRLIGLLNNTAANQQKNVCFANSVMQFLNIPEFLNELCSKNVAGNSSYPVLSPLYQHTISLLSSLNSNNNTNAVNPSVSYSEILKVLPSYRLDDQYDAQEMLQCLLTKLYEVVRPTSSNMLNNASNSESEKGSNSDTEIDDFTCIFKLKHELEYWCKSCPNKIKNKTFEYMWPLEVDSSDSSLRERLEKSLKVRELDDFNCTPCGVIDGKADVKASWTVCPQFVIVNLKIFTFTQVAEGFVSRRMTSVSITIDEFIQSMDLKTGNDILELCGVIYHGGNLSLSCGHYTCSIKKGNEWFLLNDGQCRKQKPLLRFRKGKNAKLPYLVMYRRTSNIQSLMQSTVLEETDKETLNGADNSNKSTNKRPVCKKNDTDPIAKKPRTCAERKRNSRCNRNEEELHAENRKKREAEAERRSQLTEEQRHAEDRKKREAEAERRSQLNEKELDAERKEDRDAKIERRSRLTEEQLHAEDRKKREAEAERRSQLTEEQRHAEDRKKREAEAERRSQLTEEQRNAEDTKKREAEAQRRFQLNEEELDTERKKDRDAKAVRRSDNQKNSNNRIRNFKRSIMYGRIFECVCCHRRLFQDSMRVFEEDQYKQKLLKKYPELPNLYEDSIGEVSCRRAPDEEDGSYWICHYCDNYHNKGKMPPMSHKNALTVIDTSAYPELNLTEVEQCLIAVNLIFQKIYQLPKSRWPAMKDRIINVPVYESDILNTLKSLPRTPTEGGVIAVKLKRKVQYKNAHKCQYVSVRKIMKALSRLKELGNKYYQFLPPDILSEEYEDNFMKRCEENDLNGFKFLYPDGKNECRTARCGGGNDDSNDGSDNIKERGASGIDNTLGIKTESTVFHHADSQTVVDLTNNNEHNQECVESITFDKNSFTKIVNDDDNDGIQNDLSENAHSSLEMVDFHIDSAYFNNEDKKNTDLSNTAEDKAVSSDIPDDDIFTGVTSTVDDNVGGRRNEENEDEEEEDDKEEIDFKTKDHTQKYSFDYNRSSCVTNDFPEIKYNSNIANNAISIAPGEGKIPSNIQQEVDWDVRSFPCLHPNGLYGLHDEKRRVNLSDQNYFVQRLMNKNNKFAHAGAYVFAACGYVESKQMSRNLGISFMRGQRTASSDGGLPTYELKDPCSVLDNMKNTPRFWLKFRGDQIARLQNLGPFIAFFSLSCGDQRWPENFTSLLDGYKIVYESDGDECTVDGVPLEEFLARHIKKAEAIKKNLLNATLTFCNRVKKFIKHIVMNKQNPMAVNFYSYKVEFQFRGAAHIHGVLWIDWTKCKLVPNECIVDEHGNSFEINHIANVRSLLTDIKNGCYTESTEAALPSACMFADKMVTCTLLDPSVNDIVREVNYHHHSRTCRKYGTPCRFSFPKYPTTRTIIAVPSEVKFVDMNADDLKKTLEGYDKLLRKVKAVLEDEIKMKPVLDLHSSDLHLYMAGELDEEELLQCRIARIEKLLEIADTPMDDNASRIPYYEEALSVTKKGYTIIYQRDVAEIFVNTYNTEWIQAWNANMDIQLCLDYYAVITYISEYYSKDDSGTSKYIQEALKGSSGDVRIMMKKVVDVFLTHRQIGESEAYFRTLPFLHLKESNIKCIFVESGYERNTSKFLKKVDSVAAEFSQEDVVQVKNKEDEYYVEKPSRRSKYKRRDCEDNKDLEKLTYAQFAQRYMPCRTLPKKYQNKTDLSTNLEDELLEMEDDMYVEVGEDVNNPCDDEPLHDDSDAGSLADFIDDSDITDLNGDGDGDGDDGDGDDGVGDGDGDGDGDRDADGDDDDGDNSDEELTDVDIYRTGDELVTERSLKRNRHRITLPPFIKLTNLKYDEPPYMRLRSPLAVKFHHINQTKKPYEFMFSQLMLYHPFKSEEEIGCDDDNLCLNLYNDHKEELKLKRSLLFPHMDAVIEATEDFEPIVTGVGVIIDPCNEQDNDDCVEEGVTEHPQYIIKNPADLMDNHECNPGDSKFSKITLKSDDEILAMIRKLDEEQRRIFDITVDYAITWKRWKENPAKFRGPPPTAPIICVQGGAGTGKSFVIKTISQKVEQILRTSGDNPYHPYVIKVAFTGTAASLIGGQTITSAFSLSFSGQDHSSPDNKVDARKEDVFQLAFVLEDEFSFVRAEVLYQQDFRLKELKDDRLIFGGVAMILFGDVMQLRPIGNYIFQRPSDPKRGLHYDIDRGLWGNFKFIILTKNHRQGDDKAYADLLNRLSVGETTDEDMRILMSRHKQYNDPDIPADALRIFLINETVNEFNEFRLDQLPGDEVVFKASILRPIGRRGIPRLENTGAIKGTALQYKLRLKQRARVMLTANIDTKDHLTNGAFGEVEDFEVKVNAEGQREVKSVLVRFDDPNTGAQLRMTRPDLRQRYEDQPITPITALQESYSLSQKKTLGSSTIPVIQFPLRLAFAATVHKMQGDTVHKPMKLVIDLTGRKQAAIGYVALSRVQELDQLIITGSFSKDRLFPNSHALDELKRMKETALNNDFLIPLLTTCNALSFKGKYADLKTSPFVFKSSIVCIQETWFPLSWSDEYLQERFAVDGYKVEFNGRGNGKGIAVYYNDNFRHITSITMETYWMTKVQSSKQSIINVYRSSHDRKQSDFLKDLDALLSDASNLTYAVGDFNEDLLKNEIQTKSFLEERNFQQYVQFPTHRLGGLLDHVYVRNANVSIVQESTYFTDHDIIYVMEEDEIVVEDD